jgi:hypothetical protein
MSESKPVKQIAFEAENHINIDYHDKDGNVIAHHNYAVDEHGKKHHISIDDTLITRGYDPEAYKNEPVITKEGSDDVETKPNLYDWENEEADTSEAGVDDESLDERNERLIREGMQELRDAVEEGKLAFTTGDKIAQARVISKVSRLVDMITDLNGMSDDERDEWMSLCLSEMMEGAPSGTDEDDEPEPEPVDPERSHEILESQGKLAEARDNLAKLNLKVAGKIITGPKIKKQIAEAEEQWRKLQAKVTVELFKLKKELGGEELSPEEVKVIAMGIAIAEAKSLAEQEALLASQGGGGNVLSRAWKRYAASYEKAGFIGKAIRLAPAGILAGVAVGTVFGVVGGGIFGALIAKGATKGALTAKVRASGSITEASTNKEELDKDIPLTGEYNATTIEEIAAMRAADVNTRASKERVEGHVRKNRKRMAGSVALGAVLGGTFGAITNQFLDQSPLGGRGLYEHKIEKPSIIDQQPTPTPPAEVVPIPTGVNPIEYAGSQGIDLGAPNAWPFKIADQLGLSQQDSIDLARQQGFSYEGGKYWIQGRMMNATEMKFHNIGLAEIAAKRFQG